MLLCACYVPVDCARGYLCAFSFDTRKVLMNEKSVPREAVDLGMVGSWGLHPSCVRVRGSVSYLVPQKWDCSACLQSVEKAMRVLDASGF